jgi:hypothetical protein
MTEFVIHIGPHKTGSSYLQSSFEKSRSWLAERGVEFPEQWKNGVGHARLAARLRADDRSLVQEFSRLKEIGHRIILLSAEDLSDLPRNSIALLGDCIGTSPAQIIFYCRRWSELFASGWQEMVKHGEFQTLPEFVTSHTINPYISRIANFGVTLQLYSEVFSRDSIKLASYSELMDRKQDLLPHFISNFLGILSAPLHEKSTINASLAVHESELIRALNSFEWASGFPRASRMYKNFVGCQIDTYLPEIYSAMDRSKRAIRMNEATGSLLDLHRQLASDFSSALVPPRPEQLLFRPQFSEIPFIGGEYLVCRGVVQKMLFVYERMSGSV